MVRKLCADVVTTLSQPRFSGLSRSAGGLQSVLYACFIRAYGEDRRFIRVQLRALIEKHKLSARVRSLGAQPAKGSNHDI